MAKSIHVKTGVRAGGINPGGSNHNRTALRVRAAVRAGGINPGGSNHNRSLLVPVR